MVEAMNEQSSEFFEQLRKNFKFFVLDKEPDVSELPPKTNCAFAVHSIQYDFCSQSLEIRQPHLHVLIKVAKDCIAAVNKTTSKAFIVPCTLSSFKYLIMGCSKYHLSGPLMEKIKLLSTTTLLTTLTLAELLSKNDYRKDSIRSKVN